MQPQSFALAGGSYAVAVVIVPHTKGGVVMFYNWRWLHKLLAVALISLGIGLLIATLLEWGWFMVLISLIAMIVGLFILLGEC